MNRIIIFDFNRTLYDPDADRMMYGARGLLRRLRKQKLQLYLISTANPTRLTLIRRLGLFELFDQVVLVSSKSSRPFNRIIRQSNADVVRSFVIGDRITQEITLGNRCGLRTVWVKRGKFRHELPQKPYEEPDYIVTDVRQVQLIV